MSVNKVILVGRLGQNPELRNTPGGAAVTNFSVATNESWNDKNGQKQERTEWHRVVVWGKLAELCQQYLQKGRQVYLEGRLQTRQWQDKDGQTRYTTEIQAQTVQFLGGGARDSADQGQSMNQGMNHSMNQGSNGPSMNQGYGDMPSAPPSGARMDAGPGTFTEDDIPF